MQILFYPNALESILKDLADFKLKLLENPSITLEKIQNKQETPKLLTEVSSSNKNLTLVLGAARSLPEPLLSDSMAYLSAFLIALEVGLLYLAQDNGRLKELFDDTSSEIILSQLEKDKSIIKRIMNICSQCLELLYQFLPPENNPIEKSNFQDVLLLKNNESRIIKSIFYYFGLNENIYLDENLYKRVDESFFIMPNETKTNEAAVSIVDKQSVTLNTTSSLCEKRETLNESENEPVIVEYNRDLLLKFGLKQIKKEDQNENLLQRHFRPI